MQLTENFTLAEFACNCAVRSVATSGFCRGDTWPHDILVVTLQTLRYRLQKPIAVVSGCRCHAYNRHVGGAPRSQHCKGLAADIRVAGMTPEEVAEEAERAGFRGTKAYPEAHNNFCHVDCRREAIWRG